MHTHSYSPPFPLPPQTMTTYFYGRDTEAPFLSLVDASAFLTVGGVSGDERDRGVKVGKPEDVDVKQDTENHL